MPEPPLTPAPGLMAPGVRIGARYKLVAQLARGGMAEVWEAVDEVLTRPVAVKVLLPHLAADKAFVTRFRREAISAARLSDPHIVSIYDTCSEGDVEAIVMELVRGTTLRLLLDERGRLHPGHAIGIAVQVADALEHAHRSGLVHRDIKPGNILLADDNRVLVADFGIAKAVEASADLTEVGQVVGTAKYLSPEQVEGLPLDARSDVYALGIVLYEMLCGRAPFVGDNATTTAVARLTSEPLRPRQIRAGLPRALEDIVVRAMARRPGDRYASAAELRSALEHVDLSGVEPGDDATTTGDATSAWSAAASSRPRSAPEAPASPMRAPAPAPRFAQTERSWLVPAVLILVVAVTLGVVGVLLGKTDVGRGLFDAVGGGPPAQPGTGATTLSIASVDSFDPFGSGGEHNDELSLAVDGKPGTSWTTEQYGSRDLGGLKDGVGIVVELQTAADLKALQVTSPTKDWAAAVYVAAQPADSLEGWGDPVDEQDGIAGDATFDLQGNNGSAVLLWITDLGDGSVGNRFSTAINSLRLS